MLLICLALNLSIGAKHIPVPEVIRALIAFDDSTYDHFIVLYQRFPRALIAMFVGSMMAICGMILQGLTRNPLASPSLLGVSSGASLFVIGLGFYTATPDVWHGALAFAGGWFGFFSCLALAKVAGIGNDPRNLSLILAGAIVSILYSAIANALLLADPGLRLDLLNWITGNINHVYIDRLYDIWWVWPIVVAGLMALAAPLTLILLGADKAQSAGVAVKSVSNMAILLSVGGAAASVSVCGPIGFVGLVVPHMVRPFAGAHFRLTIPLCALLGGAVVLLADLVARIAFAPFVLHTAIVMELLGGVLFIFIVKRFYLSSYARAAA